MHRAEGSMATGYLHFDKLFYSYDALKEFDDDVPFAWEAGDIERGVDTSFSL